MRYRLPIQLKKLGNTLNPNSKTTMEDNKNQPIIPSRDNINKFSEGTDCKSAIPENDRIDGRIAYIDCQ